MVKRTKQKGRGPLEKSVYLSIIDSVKNYGKIPDLGMTSQAKQRYIKKLVSDGKIKKIGYGTWEYIGDKNPQKELNTFCWSPLKGGPQGTMFSSFKIRGHGFQFKVKIPKLKNWDRRKEFLKKHHIKYDNVGIRKSTPSITHKDIKVWLANHSLTIYFPEGRSYFGDTAQETKEHAAIDLVKFLGSLGRLLKTSFKIGREFCFKFSKFHFSNVNNCIAKEYNKQEKKLQIRYNGDLWLVIDNSFHLDEMETVNSTTADKDMDRVIMPFFNDLKGHHDNTGETLQMTHLMRTIHQVAKNQAYHEENIKTHIGAIKELGESSTKMSEILTKIEKRLGD